jgi:hypothetical protein
VDAKCSAVGSQMAVQLDYLGGFTVTDTAGSSQCFVEILLRSRCERDLATSRVRSDNASDHVKGSRR